MGNPNYLVKKEGYGHKKVTLDCAAWDKVVINANKYDYGEGELKVKLLRNGEIVAENSTTNVTGGVTINYN